MLNTYQQKMLDLSLANLGEGVRLGQAVISDKVAELEEHIKYLESLIDDRDKEIEGLQAMLDYYQDKAREAQTEANHEYMEHLDCK